MGQFHLQLVYSDCGPPDSHQLQVADATEKRVAPYSRKTFHFLLVKAPSKQWIFVIVQIFFLNLILASILILSF